jgi:hypothetical protein
MKRLDYWRGYAVGWAQAHRHYLKLDYWRGRFS